MNFLRNLRLGARLGLAFGVVITLSAAVVLIGITRLSHLTDSLSLIGSDRVPKLQQVAEMTDNVNLIARELRNALIFEDPAAVSVALETVTKTRAEIAKIFETMAPTITSDEGKAKLAVLSKAREAYLPVQQQFVDLVKGGKAAEARTLLEDKLRPAQLAYIGALGEFKNVEIELVNAAVAEGEAAARTASETARAKEQAHATAREQRASAEAHAGAAAARLADIVTLAREQADVAPEELADRTGALLNSALGQGAIQDIERRFDRLKSERDAAGPVNLRAEEELQDAQARLETITREKEDVAQAVAKLRGAITKLNNEGRTRLMRAFEEVDAHFAQLFAALFEGGQAALKLTESEDPLEAGLEIFAQPPGKRLTNLSLLSGGEQALTATALIFAVFLSNPAPLCVLDEVDAPLDDANVDRFCRMLEEMKRLTRTRFIVITHNPVTMSRMDRLYGVTMPEQGLSQLVSVDLSRAQAMAAE